MVADDTELADNVRALTDYDETILTDSELQEVIQLAKGEFWADTDTSEPFYSGNKQADQALFWLTCLFAKIKVGELSAPDFQIAEIDVEQSSDEESRWFSNYRRYRDIATAGSSGKIGQISRSNRTYQFDN